MSADNDLEFTPKFLDDIEYFIRNVCITDMLIELERRGPDSYFEDIMQNIVTINTKKESLEKYLDVLRTNRKDFKNLQEKLKTLEYHTNMMILQTSEIFINVKVILIIGDLQNQLRFNKVYEHFMEAITKYVNAQEEIVQEIEKTLAIRIRNSRTIDGSSSEEDSLLAEEEIANELKKYIFDINMIPRDIPIEISAAPSPSTNRNGNGDDYIVDHIVRLQDFIQATIRTRNFLILSNFVVVVLFLYIMNVIIVFY